MVGRKRFKGNEVRKRGDTKVRRMKGGKEGGREGRREGGKKGEGGREGG